ncbi:MAG: 30S ribosomal protein S17 [Candidatus Margulisbacteria bacterium]|nr:30S ribosomal protein S17 [Candidatus Margulisiibacteriota bacterium]
MDRGRRKEKTGVVVSDRMNKTIVVEVKRNHRHPVFNKVVKSTNRFKAHDEKNEAKIGDTVLIAESRPISKDKRWRLVKIVGHGLLTLRELPARKQKALEEVKGEEEGSKDDPTA